jgi:hypothetical protein
MRLALALAVLFAPAIASAEPAVSPYLYLNRCVGGCTVTGGFDDARAMTSSIPCSSGATCTGGGCMCTGGNAGTYVISEFRDSAGQTGAAADPEWNEIVKCVREVYSPYNVMVTDTLPPGGLSHNQGIVAGRPSEIGYTGIGGIAPGTPGCDPRDNVISFTFANIYGGAGMQRVWEICSVVSQETAHAYGLDHAYEYVDKRSACTDPMSYRGDCGGQRFFRNESATCGEFGPRLCRCGGFQNSHLKIQGIFGAATPITRPPSVVLNQPATGAVVTNGATVVATASAQRGIARMELWLNNWEWTSVKGAAFGPTGQPESSYPLTFPAGVPDSVIDVVVKAYDDLEIVTASETITVTKGAPCTSATTCAKGQKCEAGKCFWDAPTGEVGDSCSYPQFCKTNICLDTTDGMFCSQECVVGVTDSCPLGFTCEGTAGGTGKCVDSNAGDDTCCGIGANGKTSTLLSLLVVTLVLRRKRRR